MPRLLVTVDDRANIDVQIQATILNRVQLLGAIEVAKDAVLNLICSNTPDQTVLPQTATKYDEKEREDIVTKNDAINHYLAMRDVIEKRLVAISASDPRARFTIQKHLIHTI